MTNNDNDNANDNNNNHNNDDNDNDSSNHIFVWRLLISKQAVGPRTSRTSLCADLKTGCLRATQVRAYDDRAIDSCCKEFLCFNTTPCRHVPLLVHFWASGCRLADLSCGPRPSTWQFGREHRSHFNLQTSDMSFDRRHHISSLGHGVTPSDESKAAIMTFMYISCLTYR